MTTAETSFKDSVLQLLADSGPKVKQVIVDQMVEEEIIQRVTLVKQAIPILSRLRGLATSFKADLISYDIDGAKKDESWSKQNLENKKKAEEHLTKFELAFSEALENSSFDGLKKLVAQNSQPQAQTPDSKRGQ